MRVKSKNISEVRIKGVSEVVYEVIIEVISDEPSSPMLKTFASDAHEYPSSNCLLSFGP